MFCNGTDKYMASNKWVDLHSWTCMNNRENTGVKIYYDSFAICIFVLGIDLINNKIVFIYIFTLHNCGANVIYMERCFEDICVCLWEKMWKFSYSLIKKKL